MPFQLRIAQIREIDDLRLVGAGRIAHPDPHQVIALDDRVAPHAQLRRDHVLAGDLGAAPGRVVPDAVIHAAHAVALTATLRQQRTAMRAAVVQRNDLAAVAPVEQHVILEQRAGEHSSVDQLVVPGGDVPAVSEEH